MSKREDDVRLPERIAERRNTMPLPGIHDLLAMEDPLLGVGGNEWGIGWEVRRHEVWERDVRYSYR